MTTPFWFEPWYGNIQPVQPVTGLATTVPGNQFTPLLLLPPPPSAPAPAKQRKTQNLP